MNRLQETEREKLLHLKDDLHKRVVGQDEAVEGMPIGSCKTSCVLLLVLPRSLCR